MGKVGSTSVVRTLERAGLGVPVHHAHLLHELDEVEASIRARYASADQTLRQIERGRRTRALFDADPTVPWSVVTLVRDPVARNVSAFFQRLHEIDPEVARAPDLTPTPDLLERLVRSFHERYHEHRAPLQWIDHQLAPVLGVDVFEHPFDRARGWNLVDARPHRLLLCTTEVLDTERPRALAALLGGPPLRMLRGNEASTKRSGDLYRRFRAVFRPGEDYLDEMYGSRTARHFYDEATLERFRASWSGPPAEA